MLPSAVSRYFRSFAARPWPQLPSSQRSRYFCLPLDWLAATSTAGSGGVRRFAFEGPRQLGPILVLVVVLVALLFPLFIRHPISFEPPFVAGRDRDDVLALVVGGGADAVLPDRPVRAGRCLARRSLVGVGLVEMIPRWCFRS